MKVIILGASNKPDRFSNKALHLLKSYGHEVYPVNPRLKQIDGTECFESLASLEKLGAQDWHTITLYLSPEISSKEAKAILKIRPQRVVFNPGAENPALFSELQASGIQCVERCTLVMLNSQQF